MNQINNMNQDLTNNASLLTIYTAFCNNLANNISNNLNNLIFSNNSLSQPFTTWITQYLNNTLVGSLQYYTYAYETSTLLNWWTANINLIGIQLTTDLSPYFLNWINAFQIINNSGILNNITGSQLATVVNSGSNNYNVNSALNSNSNLTISQANSNSNTINNYNLLNGTMDDDTTPIKESQAQFNSGVSSDSNGVNIANFLLNTTANIQSTFKKQLENWLQPYLLQFNDLDNSTRRFNW